MELVLELCSSAMRTSGLIRRVAVFEDDSFGMTLLEQLEVRFFLGCRKQRIHHLKVGVLKGGQQIHEQHEPFGITPAT